MKTWTFVALAALTGLAACKTTDSGGQRPVSDSAAPAPSASPTGSSGGTTTSGSPSSGSGMGTGSNTGTGTSATGDSTDTGSGSTRGGVPALISVNLQNVLNNLSVSLQVNRNSIPVTAQVPIDVAASVCGISVDALAASLASGHGTCTATTTSPQLNQIVQQQISTGGNVQGGAQTIKNGT